MSIFTQTLTKYGPTLPFSRHKPLKDVGKVRAFAKLHDGIGSPAFEQRREALHRRFQSDLKPAQKHQCLVEAVAIADEAVFRTHGFHMHDVQLAAVLAVSDGAIAEMQTGEGKTIVTGATAFVKSLIYPYVHVSTTNQYLATRDCESLKEFFDLLNTSSASLPEKGETGEMQQAYDCQITYGPGYQFGFDFLRDQMTLRAATPNALGQTILNQINGIDIYEQLIQRSRHHAMIVDEADSVMIDEAMTPMILSSQSDKMIDRRILNIANRVASELIEDTDYSVDRKHRRVELDEDSKKKIFEALSHVQQMVLDRPWTEYVQNALQANCILTRDEDYVVQDDKVMIVDQMTGRIFADRSWKNGLHQAVEAKEGVEINPGNDSSARITRQRYFQFYDELCGLTGTARQVKDELLEVYGCPVIEIPTNKTSLRLEMHARYFATAGAKMRALGQEVKEMQKKGQPVLVGTRTIRESILAENAIRDHGLNPVVLNGTQDDEEADIVSVAGRKGAITIATNMAGRGTDIKLTPEVIELGGLHVIATEHNHSRRVDRQLIGRCARQGKPGSYQFFVSGDDELIIANDESLSIAMKHHCSEDGECTQDHGKTIENIQKNLEREGYQSRQSMIRQDRWMDKIRESVESFGD